MDKNSSPLKVALHAMDERSCKVMIMYLQGPCRGFAVAVNDSDAQVDIFDGDSSDAARLLQERLAQKLPRPIVVMSLNDKGYDNVLMIKKPVRTDDMFSVLQQAKNLALKIATGELESADSGLDNENDDEAALTQPALKQFVIDNDERNKKTKHEAAMQLTEKGFGAFIGNVAGVDVNDPTQFMLASYNPKEYFQGFVASAFKISKADGKAKQLNSGWNPLFIFPQNYEVWLDADEKQLRAFAGLTITNNTVGTQISIHSIDAQKGAESKALEKFHSMDAFLWKLACWASKGRYPISLTIQQPVYLKNWPNFTRLLVTPHALRIAALLIREPRTLPSIAELLDIKPQYVFVFISAAHALGLVDQAKRSADMLVDSSAVTIKPSKNQGLLGRIMSKLRS